MKIYVGVTDFDWYSVLNEAVCDEVNFWRPNASTSFKAIQVNDMFLFKLHKPLDYIVGGGFFVRYSVLPAYLAWDAFGIKNGATSLGELNRRVKKYRRDTGIKDADISIGCIILTEPFFFNEQDWIPIPEDWSPSIVQGKTYSEESPHFTRIMEQVSTRLATRSSKSASSLILSDVNPARYIASMTKHRLGQGGFRISVIDAYSRRCAITGEKSLPVLEAVHIKPYAENGPHIVCNGLLLRSDYHQLYDRGYITVTPDYGIEVSRRLNEHYGNGKLYYAQHGKKLIVIPSAMNETPSREYLQWHNENVYMG